MTSVKLTFEDVLTKLSNLKEEIIKESKRVLKAKVPQSESVRSQVRHNLLIPYNNFILTVASFYDNLNDSQYKTFKALFSTCRDRVVRSYQVLCVDYKIPVSILTTIDPEIIDELLTIDLARNDGDDLGNQHEQLKLKT